MALIRSVQAGRQTVKPHGTQVDCFAQQLTAADGTLLVHLSTFGSDHRASPAKSSQSMQFDRERAADLIEQFVTVFGDTVLPSRRSGSDGGS
ncbi:hypothetical protein [Curtobacterium sp. MCBD17_026]|uniref:hypothetical protein n=1 Tax=Curtobacterium sp. MCBD17_026 TaxID=2175621 RepID=UPI0011B6B540|nr:hypothetical protein [Curtobacterium sp. MCBD17_026]WIB69585.1 hypothetical protein DEI85_10430 [Curtobacterium sp. MCBD17_026]